MSKETFPYKSLYEYLSVKLVCFSNPTDEEIKALKAQYWKEYYSHYQKQRRQRVKEFTLGFNSNMITLIHQKRDGQSVSEYLYSCVFNALEGGPKDLKLIQDVYTNQMEIIANLEELIEEDNLQISDELLEKMEALAEQIQNLLR